MTIRMQGSKALISCSKTLLIFFLPLNHHLPVQPGLGDSEVRLRSVGSVVPIIVSHRVQKAENSSWLTAAASLQAPISWLDIL